MFAGSVGRVLETVGNVGSSGNMNSVIVGEFKVDEAGVGNSDGENKGDRRGVKSRLGLREISSNENSEDDASGS